MAYLGNLDVAYGIKLTDVRPVGPLALERPDPRSWRYLFADDPDDARVLNII